MRIYNNSVSCYRYEIYSSRLTLAECFTFKIFRICISTRKFTVGNSIVVLANSSTNNRIRMISFTYLTTEILFPIYTQIPLISFYHSFFLSSFLSFFFVCLFVSFLLLSHVVEALSLNYIKEYRLNSRVSPDLRFVECRGLQRRRHSIERKQKTWLFSPFKLWNYSLLEKSFIADPGNESDILWAIGNVTSKTSCQA